MSEPIQQTPERLAWLRSINREPRDRLRQLVFADWLEERNDPAVPFWRRGRLVRLVRLGGLGGRGRLGGLGGPIGLGGLIGRGGLVGPVGPVGLSGRVGRGGRGWRGWRGGIVGELLDTENPIVLIPGENALVFLPHGYGCAVLVGTVAAEYPAGWIVDPCREVIDTQAGDNWVTLAGGKNKQARSQCEYGEPIQGGMRVPVGCYSMVWQGDLPE